MLETPRSCYCGGEMLAMRRDARRERYCCECISYSTHESESDRARVRFSDLLTCADLTDLRIGRPLKIFEDMFIRFERMYECDRHHMTAKATLDVSIARQKSLFTMHKFTLSKNSMLVDRLGSVTTPLVGGSVRVRT